MHNRARYAHHDVLDPDQQALRGKGCRPCQFTRCAVSGSLALSVIGRGPVGNGESGAALFRIGNSMPPLQWTVFAGNNERKCKKRRKWSGKRSCINESLLVEGWNEYSERESLALCLRHLGVERGQPRPGELALQCSLHAPRIITPMSGPTS